MEDVELGEGSRGAQDYRASDAFLSAPLSSTSGFSDSPIGPFLNSHSTLDDDTDSSVSVAKAQETQAPDGVSLCMVGLVVFHCFMSFVICNLDRINLSVAILPMADEFGWSESRKGVVQASFFCGYITTAIAGGRLADRIGGRRVLAGGVASWSLMTFLTPFAAKRSLPVLLGARVLMGVGEGVAMPAMNSIVNAWVPTVYVSRALGFIYSGMYFGSICGLIVSPVLIEAVSWESVFYVCGLVGLAWVAAFLLSVRSDEPTTPDSHPLSVARPSYAPVSSDTIVGTVEKRRSGKNHRGSFGEDSLSIDELPTMSEILSHVPVWAIVCAHFCCTWGFFVLLTWLPSYFSSRFNLDVSQSSFLSIGPWVMMCIFANVAGFGADWMIRQGFSKSRVRKLMQSIGFIGPSVFLCLLMTAKSRSVATIYIGAALGLSSFSQGGVYCNHQDIAGQKKCAGTLLGLSNTVATIPGIVGVSVSGYILDVTSGNWNAVFGLAVVFYAIGTVVYIIWGSAEPIFG